MFSRVPAKRRWPRLHAVPPSRRWTGEAGWHGVQGWARGGVARSCRRGRCRSSLHHGQGPNPDAVRSASSSSSAAIAQVRLRTITSRTATAVALTASRIHQDVSDGLAPASAPGLPPHWRPSPMSRASKQVRRSLGRRSQDDAGPALPTSRCPGGSVSPIPIVGSTLRSG